MVFNTDKKFAAVFSLTTMFRKISRLNLREIFKKFFKSRLKKYFNKIPTALRKFFFAEKIFRNGADRLISSYGQFLKKISGPDENFEEDL